ncbi:hypothetical protein EYV94_23480 [Puteibacter caeruleilacunae]|nr:hypothetical protein EYV94_23480 [Puteibacter caeruleilacunae]
MKRKYMFILAFVAAVVAALIVSTDSSVKIDLSFFEEEADFDIPIEEWMYSDFYFSSTTADATMEIEEWMTDEKYWK